MYKFATRNFSGKIVKCYTVTEQSLPKDVPSKKRVGHHIMVVDASGSMYGDIAEIKEKIRKVLTLDEYRDSEMLVSLLSYSSSGDLVEHFIRVKVADIVKSKNTKAQREIGSLKARGMTCMTQGLEAALALAKAGGKSDLTAVSLHTDGYFNDPSPSAEFRKIGTLIDEFKKLDGVFVNTIGYRDWCDFPVLDKIANSLSGKCWRASDIKTFYDSLYDTSTLLAGQTAPAIFLEKNGEFDYQVFVSEDGKIVGSAGDLQVSGVRADVEKNVLRFKQVDEKTYEKSKAPDLPIVHALAFAKTQLSEGKVTAAKYTVVGARLKGVLDKHARALSGSDLAAFGEDLEKLVFDAEALESTTIGSDYGLGVTQASVPAILDILAEHREDFVLNVAAFVSSYKRRGLKSLTGTWEKDRLIKPAVRTALRDQDTYVPVAKFDFNRSNATINMMIAQPCKLLRIKDGTEIKELGGIKLDLVDFKQYTLVGDGVVNAPLLRIRVTNKRLHRKLADAGVLTTEYNPKVPVDIRLDSRPLVEYGATFTPSAFAGIGDRLARLHAVEKLLGGLVKAAPGTPSAELSADQIAELKKYYVTPKFNVSMPSARPYTDLQKAITDGDVDVRLGYDITVGSEKFIDPTDLYSGNEFLRRWYEVEGAADPKKPCLSDWYSPDFKVKHKKLGARVKVGAVDHLMAEVFDEFFQFTKTGLFEVTFGDEISKKFYQAIDGGLGDEQAYAEVIADAQKKVAAEIKRVYSEEVSPLVFYIGSSGLIPEDFGDVAAMTAEQLLEKYPEASITKAMRDEGTFYDIGGAIVTVVRSQEYFTTDKGLRTAAEIESKAVAALG